MLLWLELSGEERGGRKELGQKSKISFTGLKASCQQDCVPSEGSRGEAIFTLSQLLEAVCVP